MAMKTMPMKIRAMNIMSINKDRWIQTLLYAGVVLLFAATSVTALAKQEEKSNYPNATRSAPKSDLSSSSDQKTLKQGIDALNSRDDAKAQTELQKILDSSKSKYARGIALEGLANLKFNSGDYKAAIADYKQLLDLKSVPNDPYFDSMFNMVNAYVADEQYQAALDQLKLWRDQGKRETADSYAIEGNIHYREKKYPEAIAAIKKAQSLTDKPKDSWNSILMASYAESGQGGQAAGVLEQEMAKDPNNKKLIHNALVVYQQSNANDKALALLEREHAQGLMSDEEDYVTAAKFYASIGQNSDTPATAVKGAALLQEGMTKGIVKPTADNYKLIGDAYMIGQQEDHALGAYDKASPLAVNGDIDYRRAEILGAQQNWAAAKVAAQKAISRGPTHKGKAYLLLGKLNLGLGDKAAAKAAFEQAQQDPDTRRDAAAELSKAHGTKK